MTVDVDSKNVNPAPSAPLGVLDKHSNRAFFIRFGLVVFMLHAVGGGLVLAARIVGHQEPDEKLRRALVESRIAPVGRIATSDAEMLAMSPAEAPVAPRSGEEVVQQVCAACHASGLLNAPRIHDKTAWQARERSVGGREGLVTSAIKGKGQMPPRGGLPNLSDKEIAEAIEAML